MVLTKTLTKEKFEVLRRELEGKDFLFKEDRLKARITINTINVFYVSLDNEGRILTYDSSPPGILRINNETIDRLFEQAKLKVRSALSKVGIKE